MKLRCSQFDKIFFNTFDDIAMMLPRRQLYITKMVMSIFSIIAMCSHLYSVCLISLVFKSTYFKELFPVVASKYSICAIENKKRRQSYTKYLQALSSFSTISFHLKWNGNRLLSSESECTKCFTSCRTI